VTITDLVAWLRKPIQQYLRKRLGLYPSRGEQEIQDRDTIDLDALQGWALDDRLVRAWVRGELTAGDESSRLQARFLARGWLPPGEPGAAAFLDARANVLAAAGPIDGSSLSQVHVSTRIDGVEVSGDVSVADRDGERTIFALGPGDADKPEKLLRAWVGALVWASARPDSVVGTCTLGQSGGSGTIAHLAAPADPAAVLGKLVGTWRRAWSEPIRLAERTSMAYARAVRAGEDPLRRAREAWLGGFDRPGEAEDPEIQGMFPQPIYEAPEDASTVDPEFHELASDLWLPIFEAIR
jgi:exodeoxyribonuclease V gamma subunit